MKAMPQKIIMHKTVSKPNAKLQTPQCTASSRHLFSALCNVELVILKFPPSNVVGAHRLYTEVEIYFSTKLPVPGYAIVCGCVSL